MPKIESINVTDGTNKSYEYGVYTLDTEWRDVGAVYGFLKKKPNGTYIILYIGKAASLCNRQSDHERWNEAIKKGMTHIMVHAVTSETARQAEEKALIAHYKPEMNTQHVNSGTAQKFGRAQ